MTYSKFPTSEFIYRHAITHIRKILQFYCKLRYGFPPTLFWYLLYFFMIYWCFRPIFVLRTGSYTGSVLRLISHCHDFLYSSSVSFYQVSHCATSLASPDDGHVSCTSGREVGSICTFSCSRGYELSGSTTRTCIESGNSAYWNGSESQCSSTYKNNAKTKTKT